MVNEWWINNWKEDQNADEFFLVELRCDWLLMQWIPFKRGIKTVEEWGSFLVWVN